MAKQSGSDLGDLTGVAITTPARVADFEEAVVIVGGTFVGTFSIEGSVDGDAGTFVGLPSATGLTAPVAFTLPKGLSHVQVNCTAFTSGTLSNLLGGIDEDVKT